jgi:hypothetical protein
MQNATTPSILPSLALLAATTLVACAGPRPIAPKEYLDEQTAATIRVVADPWIFVRDRSAADAERDFLNLYAIDVNRMGEHRQYIAVLQWSPPLQSEGVVPTLELRAGERAITLQPAGESPRQLGIAQPVAQSYSSAKWWYFPVEKEALTAIARAHDLQAAFVLNDTRIPYTIWRDGRAELAELTEVLDGGQ